MLGARFLERSIRLFERLDLLSGERVTRTNQRSARLSEAQRRDRNQRTGASLCAWSWPGCALVFINLRLELDQLLLELLKLEVADPRRHSSGSATASANVQHLRRSQ